jgi:hypothetical protein
MGLTSQVSKNKPQVRIAETHFVDDIGADPDAGVGRGLDHSADLSHCDTVGLRIRLSSSHDLGVFICNSGCLGVDLSLSLQLHKFVINQDHVQDRRNSHCQ